MYPQVISRHLASFRGVRICVSAVHDDFAAGSTPGSSRINRVGCCGSPSLPLVPWGRAPAPGVADADKIDSFAVAGRNGIRFEHCAPAVPPAPDGAEYRFCYHYALAPRTGAPSPTGGRGERWRRSTGPGESPLLSPLIWPQRFEPSSCELRD